MHTFYGRQRELRLLSELLHKKTANLVVIRGRRRIGKSTLAEEFGKKFAKKFTFVGLPPEKKVDAKMQRQHFANELEKQTNLRGVGSEDWDFLLYNLSQFTQKGRTLILLDEINWMGSADPTFLGKLKTAWDAYFKKNPQLIMILSGSMSAWIEKNILSSTGFFGRVDIDLLLDELPLHECNHFWSPIEKQVSLHEKCQILCVTGGVPRYLETIDPRLSSGENIKRLFFRKEGLFFHEYEKIFSDIFVKRAPIYKQIVAFIAKNSAEQDAIRDHLQISKSGFYKEYLDDLEKSNLISRDFTWNVKNAAFSKLSKYRLKDNYLRFYLKYIEPNKIKIEQGIDCFPKNFEAIMGLQFENLILNNRKTLYRLLEIQDEIEIASPYFQRKTRTQRGVQIDFLIKTKYNTLFFCAIKWKKSPIGTQVIDEMEEKIAKITIPRNCSYRTVLIHVNGVTHELLEREYFDYILDFSAFLDPELNT